jgi:hypothetical protein
MRDAELKLARQAETSYKRMVQDQQAGAPARKAGASVTLERALDKSLREDKPRGRPQAPDVCSSLRHRSRPTDNLRRGCNHRKTKENTSPQIPTTPT